jgi:catechol 2,3-dioxygenase-like lactoylglutathione lyase family enzyme
VFDETKAREFYVEFLGFKVDWEHRFEPGTPLYMQLSQDHAFCTCRNTTATGVLVLRSG